MNPYVSLMLMLGSFSLDISTFKNPLAYPYLLLAIYLCCETPENSVYLIIYFLKEQLKLQCQNHATTTLLIYTTTPKHQEKETNQFFKEKQIILCSSSF